MSYLDVVVVATIMRETKCIGTSLHSTSNTTEAVTRMRKPKLRRGLWIICKMRLVLVFWNLTGKPVAGIWYQMLLPGVRLDKLSGRITPKKLGPRNVPSTREGTLLLPAKRQQKSMQLPHLIWQLVLLDRQRRLPLQRRNSATFLLQGVLVESKKYEKGCIQSTKENTSIIINYIIIIFSDCLR
jgi:hypothetical protein